jgi:hypothetical protein
MQQLLKGRQYQAMCLMGTRHQLLRLFHQIIGTFHFGSNRYITLITLYQTFSFNIPLSCYYYLYWYPCPLARRPSTIHYALPMGMIP